MVGKNGLHMQTIGINERMWLLVTSDGMEAVVIGGVTS